MKKSQNQAASNVATSKLHKHERKVWYKLDLSAIVYPTLQRKDFFLRIPVICCFKGTDSAGYSAAGGRYDASPVSDL